MVSDLDSPDLHFLLSPKISNASCLISAAFRASCRTFLLLAGLFGYVIFCLFHFSHCLVMYTLEKLQMHSVHLYFLLVFCHYPTKPVSPTLKLSVTEAFKFRHWLSMHFLVYMRVVPSTTSRLYCSSTSSSTELENYSRYRFLLLSLTQFLHQNPIQPSIDWKQSFEW